jgi:hypothetical protein
MVDCHSKPIVEITIADDERVPFGIGATMMMMMMMSKVEEGRGLLI